MTSFYVKDVTPQKVPVKLSKPVNIELAPMLNLELDLENLTSEQKKEIEVKARKISAAIEQNILREMMADYPIPKCFGLGDSDVIDI